MKVLEWIDELEMTGHTTFSLEDVVRAFPLLCRQVIQNTLMRLKRKNRIVSVYRRFYVIMPVWYKSRGVIPPAYYMSDLMEFLKRPYYFGLLTAAKIWGAAHHASPVDYVVTRYPSLNASAAVNANVHWCYRYNMPEKFLVERKESNGGVLYSSPELTAVELVQYERHCGGLSNVATVIAELSDVLRFDSIDKDFFGYCKSTSVQRLGYILDEIVGAKSVADALFEKWRGKGGISNVCLSTGSVHAAASRNRRWHVDINEKLEVDEI